MQFKYNTFTSRHLIRMKSLKSIVMCKQLISYVIGYKLVWTRKFWTCWIESHTNS